jgi:hypothetical protein
MGAAPMTAQKAREWAASAKRHGHPKEAAAWEAEAARLASEEAGAWRNRADLA